MQTQKNCFLLKFAANFFVFFQEKTSKNNENGHFDQRLECAAPKRWWKYTTKVVYMKKINIGENKAFSF